MKAEWMANVGGEEYGPFTWDQMLNMAAEGRVTPELPIRKVSDSQWSTAAAIPGLLGGARPAAPKPAAKVAVASAPAASGKSAIKKAKPLARPPAGRPVPPVVNSPQNIPVGVPAGIPVGAPVGVPVGSPAPSASGAFNFDLNASPSGKHRAVKKSVLDDADDLGVKKKSNAPLILGALGGAVALVAILVGLTIYLTMFRGSGDEKLVATNTSTENGSANEEPQESNPGAANNPGAAAAEGEAGDTKKGSAKESAVASATSPAKADASQKLALAAKDSSPQKNWIVVATSSRFGIGNANMQISRVWLAQNEKGERAAGPAKYLFMELVISNKASSPLKYKGWNEANKNPLFLIDEKDQLYPFVSPKNTPGVGRLTKTDIPGGGSVSELLVFEAPHESFETLYMLLPQNVFYSGTKNPYFRIHITPDVLGNEGGAPVVTPPPALASGEGTDPLVAGRKVPTDPATPEGVIPAQPTTPAPATVVKTEEPPPPKKPSLIDEINKDFETREKGKKPDDGKGAEPAKKPAPAKGKK